MINSSSFFWGGGIFRKWYVRIKHHTLHYSIFTANCMAYNMICHSVAVCTVMRRHKRHLHKDWIYATKTEGSNPCYLFLKITKIRSILHVYMSVSETTLLEKILLTTVPFHNITCLQKVSKICILKRWVCVPDRDRDRTKYNNDSPVFTSQYHDNRTIITSL